MSSELAWAVLKGTAFLIAVCFMLFTLIRLRQTQVNQEEMARLRAEVNGLKQHVETMDSVTAERFAAHDRLIYGDLMFKEPATTPRPPMVQRVPQDAADIRRRLSRIEWLLYYTFGIPAQ